MPYAAPPRPPRFRDPVSGAPSELAPTLIIPATIAEILRALEIEQHLYERAKDVASRLEEDKLDAEEQREHVVSAITQEVAKDPHASMAAEKRAVETALASNQKLIDIDKGLLGIRRAKIRADEDVSVFRHRMLSLRAALRAFGGEETD